jgi:hypothetical protein
VVEAHLLEPAVVLDQEENLHLQRCIAEKCYILSIVIGILSGIALGILTIVVSFFEGSALKLLTVVVVGFYGGLALEMLIVVVVGFCEGFVLEMLTVVVLWLLTVVVDFYDNFG